jgi:hypothetical protein
LNIEEAFQAVADALNASGVPYMLVGSLSSSYYGFGRTTKDVDFVLELSAHSIFDVGRHLGPVFRLDPQMGFGTVTMTRRYIADVTGTPFKVEFFLLGEDPHNQERFRRRTQVTLLDRLVWLPTVEDVIVTKLRWSLLGNRSKDRDDVRGVIAVQGDRIDWDYVHRWCEEHGRHPGAAGRDPGLDPAHLRSNRSP